MKESNHQSPNKQNNTKAAKEPNKANKKIKETENTEEQQPSSSETENIGNDYWDRITDEPASGYGARDKSEKKSKDDLLNSDQEPGDSEFGNQ